MSLCRPAQGSQSRTSSLQAIETEIRAGNPDLQGLLLALSDWHAELRILQDEVRQHEDSQPDRKVGG